MCPKNDVIGNNLIIAWTKINDPNYKNILCAISGGSDSDVMLDICFRCDKDKKIDYVWFNTGLEYQATKDHLKYLEKKYGIKIIPYNAIMPIPTACRKYGQPFLSKNISQFIHRLQLHNFDFENDGMKNFDELIIKYPRSKSALSWWCNKNQNSSFNISGKKYLKEFMIQNPPSFKINPVCCEYAKKKVAHKCIEECGYDLDIVGVRKYEGGLRSVLYKNCFTESISGCDYYRPLFWYKNSDKRQYEEAFGVIHSKCYTEYGLERTGCAGCPFGKNFEFELEVIRRYEPKLFKAVNNIFCQSYEYTRKYKRFCENMDKIYWSYQAYLRKINGDQS